MKYQLTQEKCSASLHKVSDDFIHTGGEPYCAVEADINTSGGRCTTCGKWFNIEELRLINRKKEKLSKITDAIHKCNELCPNIANSPLSKEQREYCSKISLEAVLTISLYFETGEWERCKI